MGAHLNFPTGSGTVTALVPAALLTGMLTGLAAGLVTLAPGAAAASCQSAIPIVGDVDGDGLSDLVVGVPGRDGATGAVDLRVTTAPSRILTRSAAGLGTGARNDRFGSSVALGDVDADGCADIVTGAPGAAGAGRVYLVLGAPTGFATSGGRVLDGGSAAGDGFGSAVVLSRNLAGDGLDLWVGAPRDDVGTARDAGSVSHYAIETGPSPVVRFLGKVTESSSGVPGVAETGDHFGAVLSANRFGVLVGEPDEDVGARRDAGSATWLLTGAGPAGIGSALAWSQATPGVPGAPETGDRFGASVGSLGGDGIVGVPREDVGTATDAGMVQVLRSAGPGDVRPAQALSQDSPGVPGRAETGDRFGASVVLGRNMACFDELTVDAAIGAPTEDVTAGGRRIADAGAVTVLTARSRTGNPTPCPARTVDQNAALSDRPEAGDRVGVSLALGRHRDDAEDDVASDRAYIGVPAEDVGAQGVDAGIVQSTQQRSNGADATAIVVARRNRFAVGHSTGTVARLHYGTVIASPAGE
jgi:FG-GAP repeat